MAGTPIYFGECFTVSHTLKPTHSWHCGPLTTAVQGYICAANYADIRNIARY